MRSSRLISLLLLLVLGVGTLSGCTISARRIITIGLLSQSPVFAPAFAAFKEEMKALEQQDASISIQFEDNAPTAAISRDALLPIAQSMLRPEIDLILVGGASAAKMMQELAADTTKQIIFLNVFDPMGAGIVTNMSRPGGNLTGLKSGGAETKRLEWFTRLAPHMRTLYAPYTPTDLSAGLSKALAEANAAKLGIRFIFREVKNRDEVLEAAHNIPPEADGIYILPDQNLAAQLDEFIRVSLKHKLPMSTPITESVPKGTLISYYFDWAATGRQAARMASQALKNVKVGDLPVEMTEFFLSINVATASYLGLKLDVNLLQQANHLYYSIPAAYLPVDETF